MVKGGTEGERERERERERETAKAWQENEERIAYTRRCAPPQARLG